MLKKIFKWIGIVLGSLIVLLLAFYGFIYFNINYRVNKVYAFSPEEIRVPGDSATLALGKHLVAIKGCTDCHGGNMGGKVMIDDAALGRLVATNLTTGPGGLPIEYNHIDWTMALRHGVGRDGKPLLLMPSHESTLLTEKDMAAIIAYCQQLPPVNNELPEQKLGPMVRIMTFAGKMPLLSVEMIDHEAAISKLPENAGPIALGKYLSVSCKGCHRDNMLGGGPLAPGFPDVPSIAGSGRVGKWTNEQFTTMLRTGKTPEGRQIDNNNMPWKMTAQYTDQEIDALYAYLQSLK